MNEAKMYLLALDHLKINELHPLQKVVLEECCEYAVQNEEIDNEDDLINAVILSWNISISTIKSILDSLLKKSDPIRFHYRNQTFIISSTSSFHRALELEATDVTELSSELLLQLGFHKEGDEHTAFYFKKDKDNNAIPLLIVYERGKYYIAARGTEDHNRMKLLYERMKEGELLK